MKKLRFDAAGISDTGNVKKVNEDSFVYKVVDVGEHYAGVFAIADGVGGLEKGEVASATAISNINKWWETDFKTNYHNEEYVFQSLIGTLKKTNQDIIDFTKGRSIKMATTLSVLFIYKNKYLVIHVGDSRIYKVNGVLSGRIEQLTQDHTCYVNREVEGRTLRKSVLTECLGNKEVFNHFCSLEMIHKKEVFLVCSDGIYKTMCDKDIQEIVKSQKKDVKQICQVLVDTAKKNGEKDNISVIAIKIKD